MYIFYLYICFILFQQGHLKLKGKPNFFLPVFVVVDSNNTIPVSVSEESIMELFSKTSPQGQKCP